MAQAARGTRNLDDGEETITDDNVVAQIRKQSAWVIFESAFGAIVLAVLFWLVVP
ncbi:MAG: hypothetical protein GF341_01995 [candidate division Zixibacteria bacterium]|nr:hypothetical protein [candidate division Zixibacteria bacterium]